MSDVRRFDPGAAPRSSQRRVPIRLKLAAALAIPLIALGVVTLIEVVNVARDAREVREQTKLATATIGPNGLITALQRERNWMAADLVGVDETLELEVRGYDRTRADTDAALTQFERELDRQGNVAGAAYAPALDGLAELAALRGEIDTLAATTTPTLDNVGPTTEMFDRYTVLIAPFFRGMAQVSFAIDDGELRQGAALTETVTRQIETISQLTRALFVPATVPTGDGDLPGINTRAEISELAELHDAFRRQADALRSATGRYAEIVEESYPERFNRVIDDQTTLALETGQVDGAVFLSELDGSSLDDAYLDYRDQVVAALEDRAGEFNAAATNRQRLFGLLAAVTFGTAVALAVLMSRSITQPLRALTRQAKEMADQRLPEAVANILDTPFGEDVTVPSVAMRVTIGVGVPDVAEALNTAQDAALDLAIEQAVLRRNIADSFVSLGRRNQNLVGRQLDLITELESGETDPDALANLFRLDHLATRMRRNAESLLVLAGIEPPRQWAAPVRLTDIIRAAVGEVEDYQRVVVRDVEPATILGSAAADLAHLLAELVENALVFSPPDRTVDIRGGHRPAHGAGDPGGYMVAVIDAGLGMPPDDMAAANRRLAGSESFTVAPSKYLGHYVAGHLAERRSIGVVLHHSPGGGITAAVALPHDLLTADADQPISPGPSPSAHRALAPPAPPTPTPSLVAPTPAAPGARWHDGVVPTVRAPGPTEPSSDQLASFARIARRAHPGLESSARWGLDASSAYPPRSAALQHTAPLDGPAAGAAPPLARRDRGAQLPATQPHGILRAPPAAATPAAAPGGADGRPQRAPMDPGSPRGWVLSPDRPPLHAAAEVYGFLSSFTAGVQQGLEAARAAQPEPPDRRG